MNKKILLFIAFFVAILSVKAQDTQCQNLFVDASCVSPDTELTANFLNIEYRDTDTYLVGGEFPCPPEISQPQGIGIVADDDWSQIINLGFTFCFYGNMYDQIIVSDNGIVSFDLDEEGNFSIWNTNANLDLPSPQLQPNAIFAPFTDTLTPADPNPANAMRFDIINQDQSIPENVGNRIFVIEWDAPLYGCNTLYLKSRVLLYETSNVIDIIVNEKDFCSWENGIGIVGIQNKSATRAVVAPGRTNADGYWDPRANDPDGELWRFVPDGDLLNYNFSWYEDDGNGGWNFVSGDETILVNPTVDTTYRGELTFQGECANSPQIFSQEILVEPNFAQDDSSFTYPNENVCIEDANPIPTPTVPGGTYTIAPATGVIDAATGEIDLALTAAGTYIITYSTTGVCDSDFTINIFSITADTPMDVVDCNAYILPILTVGNYFTATGGTGTMLNAGDIITDPLTTLYIYAESGTMPNCTDESSFTITLNFSIVPDNLMDVTICDSYTLPALSANNNYYTGTNGTGMMLNAGDAVTTTQTIYVFTETNTNPVCTDEDSFLVTINTITADAPIDVEECNLYTLPVLTVGNYYTATGGTGTMLNAGDVITTTQTLYIYAESTTVPVCTDENSFVITIKTITADAPIDEIACDSYTLSVLSGDNNYFTGANGTGTMLNAGDAITTSQTIFIFAESATAPICTDGNSFTVTINTMTVDTLGDTADCISYTLPTLTSGSYFTETNGTGNTLNAGDLITSTQTIYIYGESGTIPNCTDETSFLFTLYPTPTATAPTTELHECNIGDGTANFDISELEDEIVGLQNVTLTYHETNQDATGGINALQTNPFVRVNGNIWARVENSDGCFETVEVPLTVDQCYVTIPEGFSPNSQIAENQTFDVNLLRELYPNFTINIYNRYGKEVYTGDLGTDNWNGKSDNEGNTLPTGTYFYGLKLNDDQGLKYRGWVYLQQ